MRNKCINSTPGRKSVTENGSCSDIDFLSDVEMFAVRCCFSSILAIFVSLMRSFIHITTSDLKSVVIFEFSAAIFR